ncbi:MAG: molybdopterin cofactor-binding domain-containing protein [Pseudomonadota bacterium]
MNAPQLPSRRRFLVSGLTATGALLIGVPAASGKAAHGKRELGFFVTIIQDNTLIIGSNQPEIGQGIRTTLPMLVAEELEADWSRVSVRQMPLGIVRSGDGYTWKYGGQGVGGSTGLTSNFDFMREVGARCRVLLEKAAADRWGIKAGSVTCRDSFVVHPDGQQKLPYSALIEDAAAHPMPETAPELKPVSAFRIAGKHQPTTDLDELVTGRARYGLDTRINGMKYAVLARCPHLDGSVQSVDAAAARAVPGVVDVRVITGPEPGAPYHILAAGVAVIADNTWAALKGRQALEIAWKKGPGADESTSGFEEQCRQLLAGEGQIVRNDGDAAAALKGAERTLTARYAIPFVSHAPLEPPNCFAHVTADGAKIIVPTQSPSGVSRTVANATGLERDRISVQMTRVGGGFGRRLSVDYAAEAALISKASGYPIQLVWTREDDLRHDFYRPAGLHELTAGLGEDGTVVAWKHRLASASKYYRRPNVPDEDMWKPELYADDFPAGRVANFTREYFPVKSFVPRGSWRAPAHTANAFVIQSFIDELAHQHGEDMLTFQLRLLGEAEDLSYEQHGGPTFNPGRLASLLRFVAEESGYGRSLPPGRGIGLACHFTFGGYAAHAVEVSVSDTGDLAIHRIVAAMDCGLAVNPNAALAQVEGGTVDGLSTALNLEITVRDGEVEQSNFHNYPLATIAQIPRRIEAHLKPWDDRPTGVGEIPLPPVAPALTNAIFAASGKRIRTLPLGDQLKA